MEKIKPCPFCGKNPELRKIEHGERKSDDYRYDFFIGYKLWCPNCGCTKQEKIIVEFTYSPHLGAIADETKLNEAIENWNRRVSDGENV